MANVAARLDRAMRTAGVPITGVSVGDVDDKATWTVQPSSAQGQAKPVIEAFDLADVTMDAADQDVAIKGILDNERLISAVVWAVIDALAGPATPSKYLIARAKIIAAYKVQPWK